MLGQLLGEQVRAMTFSCSEYEARNYGRFLCAILKTLNAWYDSQSDYDKAQAKWANGKATSHIHGMRRTYKALPPDQSDHTPWADFQKLVRKWHRNLSAVSGLNVLLCTYFASNLLPYSSVSRTASRRTSTCTCTTR